ncbi:serine/threonine-protein kinase [Glaciihabitans sp. UYNi722]|uniref:serine/threonine-protein kinase n=1 Tax=Glaciihabitans sp. UYNi722 TaxID=3156344 RepID=UPI00339522C4
MDPDDPWIGQLLSDRYRVTSIIGRGGMATVYRSDDIRLHRQVAVKLFAAGAANDDARRHGEVDVLARLNHPNLVTLHDAHLAGAESVMPSYLVMELVDGPDLRSTLAQGPLRGHVSALIASDIAEALVAVHAIGVVHRDLKPANILLVPTGLPTPTHRAKLADFGIAHLVGADRMTTIGTVVGTASYLSPEQASGAEPGPEADIYALGLVVLECLTGERAYPGTIVEAMSARIDHDPSIPATIPDAWTALLSQMTARDPALRPTAMEVAVRTREIGNRLDEWILPVEAPEAGNDETEALPAATKVLPIPAATDQPSEYSSVRRFRRRLVAAAVIAVLAALLALGLLVIPLLSTSHEQVQHTPTISTTPTPSSSSTPAPAPSPAVPATTSVPKNDKSNKGGNGKDKKK